MDEPIITNMQARGLNELLALFFSNANNQAAFERWQKERTNVPQEAGQCK